MPSTAQILASIKGQDSQTCVNLTACSVQSKRVLFQEQVKILKPLTEDNQGAFLYQTFPLGGGQNRKNKTACATIYSSSRLYHKEF